MKTVSNVKSKPIQYYKGIRIKADTGLHEQLAAIIEKVLPRGAKILDYGAGEGALSQRLHDMGYDVFSVDINAEDFKAQNTFQQIDFNSQDEIKTFRTQYCQKFDMVLGIEVIEHLENPWQYIRDLKELVKDAGYILISTPNITSWYSRVRYLLTGRFHQFEDIDRHYGHINPIAEDELKYICEKLELNIEKLIPGGWLPRIWLNSHPKILILNIIGFLLSFIMKGTYEGWCLIALIKKGEKT